ncbi:MULTISPECIES: metallophosphoesterase [Metallosphaera]|uniref:metallophosphoesterase family protein n=1 Tax=Metallosphaera TaxID=41980 RepID=UPI001F0570E9|nr:metallophosphoesterase [Metallosphaera sedula]MCH1770095.1 metallophosphoesterase [Metallosphaera sedula]MCP6728071.1 metallophosphoesterase [Metallosphaera sedula]
MILGAISDIHSPRYLNDFFMAFRTAPLYDLYILAGDLVDKGKVLHFDPIYRLLSSRKVVAVFGNDDFRELRDEYRRLYPSITWLEEEATSLKVGNSTIYFVGSEGVIERPTKWQFERGINREFYLKRKERLEDLLCRKEGDLTVLITHYSPAYETLKGEKTWAYPELGYPLVKELKCKPDIAIHGHAHKSTVTHAVVEGVEVYNVALPATRGFTTIRLEKS